MNSVFLIPASGVIALVFVLWRSKWIMSMPEGDDRMKKIAGYIQKGALAFLKTEYRVLALYVLMASALLGYLEYQNAESSVFIIVSFISGAVLSALAGYIGMWIATRANVRTTEAAKTSLPKALEISFAGGAVMGMGVVGLGLLGLGSLFILLQNLYGDTLNADQHLIIVKILNIVTGFSLGAESIALFARVGGGIFTKAADVGADLVGKVEAGIPEDDPRNPATIADNVGDNVGDVAGMGADLFGSYVSTIIATMVLGTLLSFSDVSLNNLSFVLLPMLISAAGIILSLAGTFVVRIKENGNPQNALNLGNFLSIILTGTASFFICQYMIPGQFYASDNPSSSYDATSIFISIVIGLTVGTFISLITEFYCSMGKRPVNKIAMQSSSGPATNIIAGLGIGMQSTAIPILILVAGIIGAYDVAGLYGVAMAATGMMATTGIQLAIDAFGPIADNAGGIAQMCDLPEKVRERTDILDATGNTTAAIGKGFAIASAALTSLALFAAFMKITGITVIDISAPRVLGGLFLGAMIPFLFSSVAMSAVGKAADSMVQEVRRQFKEIKGLLEGAPGVEPDYKQCIEISTKAAIREMILPGIIALGAPVIIGFVGGPEVLGGALAGITVSGVLMAIFMSNAGGAWDNAKKMFEKGVEIQGEMHYKGSHPHKATVIGDTVGDPFKDTSGPSMNILIKLTSIVALIIAHAIK
ncbi:MAG TPA: sodium-translocating pyrophosphatase [Bacteroidia bacterium]|nr:sodium-translocating pyrophosphatase [Bacteroidia bacterium]